jgi:hypothetical protein
MTSDHVSPVHIFVARLGFGATLHFKRNQKDWKEYALRLFNTGSTAINLSLLKEGKFISLTVGLDEQGHICECVDNSTRKLPANKSSSLSSDPIAVEKALVIKELRQYQEATLFRD